MASSSDSFIDDLLARRTVTGRTVTVPGFENLNEFQQTQVIARLRYVPRNLLSFSRGTTLTWRLFRAWKGSRRERRAHT